MRVNFSDSEGLVHTDLNNMGAYIEAQLLDTWGQLAILPIVGQESSRVPKDDYCFAMGSGGAPTAPFCAFYSSETGLRIKNRGGLIFQQIGTDTLGKPIETSPEFLSYFCSENEFQTNLASNATGNPRLDLLCVKLDRISADSQSRDIEDAVTRIITTQSVMKQNKTRCQFQVVTGTAAASPVLPATPSGYVKLAAVSVASGATNITPADVLDFRVPIGTWSYDSYALDHVSNSLLTAPGFADPVGTWQVVDHAQSVTTSVLNASVSSSTARMKGPAATNSRLIALQLFSNQTASSVWTSKLERHTMGGRTLLVDNVFTLPASFPPQYTMYQFNAVDYTFPLWGHGVTAGHARALSFQLNTARISTDTIGHLSVSMTASVISIGSITKVRYIFAGQ